MCLAEVTDAVRSLAPIPEAPVAADSDLIAELGFDSLAVVELAAVLEERFGIVFDEDDLDFERFGTPAQIAAFVEPYLAGRERAVSRG